MSEVPAETVAPDNEMTENADQAGRVIKGRGQASSFDEEENRYTGKGAQFEGLASDAKEGEPVKCISSQSLTNFFSITLISNAAIEGWIIFLTGVHEEAEEDQLMDKMSEYVIHPKKIFFPQLINKIGVNQKFSITIGQTNWFRKGDCH